MIRRAAMIVLATGSVACVGGAIAPPASAGLLSTACGVAGIFSGIAGKVCGVASGPVGKVVGKLVGGGSSAASKVAGVAALVAFSISVLAAGRQILRFTASLIDQTTTPQLRSTWFSSTYWRMTGIAALLTLPFLFAAVIQSLMRSDLTLVMRAAFGYLPLAALATAIAAPVTMLLLAGSDEMSAIITAAATGSSRALAPGTEISGILNSVKGPVFYVFFVGVLVTCGAFVLWLELVIREAAVYVIVLMLPLAFAAMVWPARRVWAVRSVELLIALILSKFAIIAVLALGGGALSQIDHLGAASAMAGVALLTLAGLMPWALIRLLPLAEVASGTVGAGTRDLHNRLGRNSEQMYPPSEEKSSKADAKGDAPADGGYAGDVTTRMREAHDEAAGGAGRGDEASGERHADAGSAAPSTNGQSAGAAETPSAAGAAGAAVTAGAPGVPAGVTPNTPQAPGGASVNGSAGDVGTADVATSPSDGRAPGPGWAPFFQMDDDELPWLDGDELSRLPSERVEGEDHNPLPEHQPPPDPQPEPRPPPDPQ